MLGLLVVFVSFTGCKKNNDSGCSENTKVAPANEEQQVLAYLNTNNITAIKFKSNMYYEIITPGSGGNPTPCSVVQVGYVGKRTDGYVFDQSANQVFNLQGLIVGWIQGIPLIQRGGKIRLYIPPSLAYGSVDVKGPTGSVEIPANSMLIFDINLINFQ